MDTNSIVFQRLLAITEKDFIRFLFPEKSRFLKLTSWDVQLIFGRTTLSQEYLYYFKSLS
uniref:Uncharacterized protein n=1 Tax=Lepeophtheirus salmonis TaxID=72036 RepID=A0A0K2TD11_LEPSM